MKREKEPGRKERKERFTLWFWFLHVDKFEVISTEYNFKWRMKRFLAPFLLPFSLFKNELVEQKRSKCLMKRTKLGTKEKYRERVKVRLKKKLIFIFSFFMKRIIKERMSCSQHQKQSLNSNTQVMQKLLINLAS